MLTALLLLVTLALAALAWRALRPRPPSPVAPDQQRVVDQARADAAVEVKAADQRQVEARKAGTLAWVNKRFGRR